MTNSRGIRWTRRAFTAGQIILIIGLCFYSLMTTTPLVAAHSEWAWSGWALGAMADAAFIMAITADSTLARHGITHLGGWVRAFKWFTGLSVVYLNIWTAVESRDAVGVAIHIIAPALVMLLAEVGPIYTAALAEAERGAQAPETDPLAPWEREAAAGPQNGAESFEAVSQAALTAMRISVPEAHDPTPVQEYREAASKATAEALAALEPYKVGPEKITEQKPLSAEEMAPLLGQVDEIREALDGPPPEPRMSNAEANKIIEEGWRHNIAATVVAKETGRHVQTVRKKYKEHTQAANGA